jgi:transposase InsO family protein
VSHATHANAALTPRARLRLARLIVEQGWSIPRAAERYDVSWKTAKKWADRYEVDGPTGMVDRSSRPHRQPNRTPAPVVRKIVHLRWKQRLGPVEIGDRLGMASSTVHAVLTRCRLNRLSHVDRATGEPIRRYEHEHPGDLLHMDVKKLGKVPDGGGWRYVGRERGLRNRAATAARTGAPKSKYRQPLIGTCFLHTVIDDHSRVAYVEARDDETKETASEVLRNAVAWFAERGVTTRRVLTENGGCYRSFLWRDTCAQLSIAHKRTRPYRPQTNGKIERFHRTLVEGWAFKKSTAPSQPDSPPCQHGSTSTTTTGPTRPSGSAHPSRGWTTWLGITPSRRGPVAHG